MQNMRQPQRKRPRIKMRTIIATISSFVGALAALLAIVQFFMMHPLPPPPNSIRDAPINSFAAPPLITPTPTPTPTPTAIPTPTPTPIPPPIHLITCSAATTDAGILKFFTQEGNVICFSGVGTMAYTIGSVVRVETGTTYAAWFYINLSDGKSHYSPQHGAYHCPNTPPLPYLITNRTQIMNITIVSHSNSCT